MAKTTQLDLGSHRWRLSARPRTGCSVNSLGHEDDSIKNDYGKTFLLVTMLALLLAGAGCQKQEPTTAPASVPIDKDFRITNIADWNKGGLGDPSAIFPIHAYGCDVHDVKNSTPLYYSKINFFISKDEENAPAIFLGVTPPGGAGSGECNLSEKESSLKSKLEPGKYKFWAVRYIDSKPDRRTPDIPVVLE